MTLLRINPNGIPETMKAERRWVLWRLVTKPGFSKPSKIPYTPWALDREASSTDEHTWGPFGAAMAAYLSELCDGIGYVLGDGRVGFDIDGCRDSSTGEIDAEALRYCEMLNSYTDVSPSGTGLHVILQGAKPGARCRIGRYELYERGRYFTVTGLRLSDFPPTVEERSAEIAAVYEQLFGTDAGVEEISSLTSIGTELSDDTLIAMASHSPKFAALWAGDIAPYPSHSEADCALCVILSFWTRRDAARIDALFRKSRLYRPKWDREDYRRRTIAHAISLTVDTFEPEIPFRPLEPDLPSDDDIDLDTPTERI